MNKRPITTTTTAAPEAESLAASLRAFMDQGAQTLGALKANVSTIIDITQGGSRLVDRTTAMVAQRPLASVAVAFGLGYVAMRIQTSKLTPLAVVGGLLYLGAKQLSRS